MHVLSLTSIFVLAAAYAASAKTNTETLTAEQVRRLNVKVEPVRRAEIEALAVRPGTVNLRIVATAPFASDRWEFVVDLVGLERSGLMSSRIFRRSGIFHCPFPSSNSGRPSVFRGDEEFRLICSVACWTLPNLTRNRTAPRATHATAVLELSGAERSLIRAVLAFSRRNFTNNAETSACSAGHQGPPRKIEIN